IFRTPRTPKVGHSRKQLSRNQGKQRDAMSYPPYTQLDLGSAEELWAKLSPMNTLFSSPSKLIYRGQANANWQLLPSALRQSERARALEGRPGDLTVDWQVFYEMRLLEMFGEFCDQV